MTDRIRRLLAEMAVIEEELNTALHEQESQLSFQIRGKRIEFEQSIRQAHLKLKTGFFRWLVTNRPQNLITGPIIYSMIVPLAILDLFVSLYQATCFPIYGVAKVRRADYVVFDRQHLEYLNFIEKFHCTYCAYGSGLIAYVGEIVARTEEYFCPIKHARKIVGSHARYARFLAYGEAADYEEKLEEFRTALNRERGAHRP
ncbi:MAG: hypothetical protein PHY45_17005 [Rhodocyclaceae bacterium]|nr:hypothetical protein [Rhodocyclaceae bacterium]